MIVVLPDGVFPAHVFSVFKELEPCVLSPLLHEKIREGEPLCVEGQHASGILRIFFHGQQFLQGEVILLALNDLMQQVQLFSLL